MPKPSAAPSESRFDPFHELIVRHDGGAFGRPTSWQAMCGLLAECERDIREQCAQRWIPVEEKLPEPDIWVIGLHEHDGKQHVTPAYGKMTGTPRRTFHFQSEFPVTHWMPLPDPPVAVVLPKEK